MDQTWKGPPSATNSQPKDYHKKSKTSEVFVAIPSTSEREPNALYPLLAPIRIGEMKPPHFKLDTTKAASLEDFTTNGVTLQKVLINHYVLGSWIPWILENWSNCTSPARLSWLFDSGVFFGSLWTLARKEFLTCDAVTGYSDWREYWSQCPPCSNFLIS